jgi:histone-lysine N-methyltransferase SETMAR
LWAEKNLILHYDNAPSHSALIVREFFAKNDMITMNHPSYSPCLAPYDFFLFRKVKTIIQGEHFGDVENIKREMMRRLKNLTSQHLKHFLQ